MLRKPFLVIAALLGAMLALPAWAQQAVYVVRHAERADASFDSALSPAGQARAARLAKMLATSGIGAIFVTERRRTAQTASIILFKLVTTTATVSSA